MNWRSLPSLNALRAFAAAAESRSYSEAGRMLNVSHAAVGQQVRALEERLGTALVERAGRGIALTQAGADLARALAGAFGEIAQAVERITGADATRPLQVSVTPTFAVSWLMPRMADFRLRHPEIELMINPTPAVVALAPGGVDVAIRYGTGRWPALEVEPLLETGVAVVAAPALIGDRRITDPARLLDVPWLQEAGTNEVSAWLARHGVVASRRVSITHLPGDMALEAARRGEGLAASATAFIAEDVAAGRLVTLFEERDPGSGYYIVTRPGVMRPPLRAFVAWLRQQRAPAPQLDAR